MSTTSLTAEDTLNSLNGFEEIAITKAFNSSVQSLVDEGGSMFGRALVFVLKRRDGANDLDAYTASMELPVRDLNEYFAEEATPEAGKDESPTEQPQES